MNESTASALQLDGCQNGLYEKMNGQDGKVYQFIFCVIISFSLFYVTGDDPCCCETRQTTSGGNSRGQKIKQVPQKLVKEVNRAPQNGNKEWSKEKKSTFTLIVHLCAFSHYDLLVYPFNTFKHFTQVLSCLEC